MVCAPLHWSAQGGRPLARLADFESPRKPCHPAARRDPVRRQERRTRCPVGTAQKRHPCRQLFEEVAPQGGTRTQTARRSAVGMCAADRNNHAAERCFLKQTQSPDQISTVIPGVFDPGALPPPSCLSPVAPWHPATGRRPNSGLVADDFGSCGRSRQTSVVFR